ncbi:MAG TPA: MBOAT family protein [Gemmatimonadaceae bacterium]|nr:MBOAT family protein [Gemmatimonadaceae bacterium]
MLFNSLAFLLFLAAVLALHASPLSWSARKVVLLVAGCVFYSAWNPVFLGLLAISAVTDWFVGTRIARATAPHGRKFYLALSLTTNLGLLATFKYGNFIANNLEAAAAWAGHPVSLPHLTLPLPIGISFYTFEALAYSIDVYRRRATPWTRFTDFGVFLTFFPHLVAGPIVRPADFRPQLESPRRTNRDGLAWGLALLTWGLFQKVVLADGLLAPTADVVFDAAARPGTLDAWAGALAFSGQIFFDFAGYTHCAIGAALALGFKLPDNFDSPYGAIGLSDFWRRWHISLSSWLRDYLYLPLGGNRHGVVNTVRNVMITMVLGGLWHGAAWTFLAWGALHGVLLVAERAARAVWTRLAIRTPGPALGRALGACTFLAVTIAWVFFRAPDLPSAFRLLSAMSGAEVGTFDVVRNHAVRAIAFALPLALVATHIRFRAQSIRAIVDAWPAPLRAVALGSMIAALVMFSNDNRAFIYFQF